MVYDVIGVGIGPFNLGLAALAADLHQLSTVFVEQRPDFEWHPGMLLPGARMQVPFYADLVSLVQPTSRFSYLSYLQARRRLFRFGIAENMFPLRAEYRDYGRWVAGQLDNLLFNTRCVAISFAEEEQVYEVALSNGETRKARHLVVGTGMEPAFPTILNQQKDTRILHSSGYLHRRDGLLQQEAIVLVGSGQSAAEIFLDLLQHGIAGENLHWCTRSPGFFPMQTSPFALELTSPDYIRHFYQLDSDTRRQTLRQQDLLYKGINAGLLQQIHEVLYTREFADTVQPKLFPNQELTDVNQEEPGQLQLQFTHRETRETTTRNTDALILATGYRQCIPDCLQPIKERICWNSTGYQVAEDYSIDSDHHIFVQNADLYSHGFNSADLGMGPYRNAIILNSILGHEHFVLEREVCFQRFR